MQVRGLLERSVWGWRSMASYFFRWCVQICVTNWKSRGQLWRLGKNSPQASFVILCHFQFWWLYFAVLVSKLRPAIMLRQKRNGSDSVCWSGWDTSGCFDLGLTRKTFVCQIMSVLLCLASLFRYTRRRILDSLAMSSSLQFNIRQHVNGLHGFSPD